MGTFLINLLVQLVVNYFTSYTYDKWREKNNTPSDTPPIVMVLQQTRSSSYARKSTQRGYDHRAVNRAKLGRKISTIFLYILAAFIVYIAFSPIFFTHFGSDTYNLGEAKLTSWISSAIVQKSDVYTILTIVGIIAFIPLIRSADKISLRIVKWLDKYEVVTYQRWIQLRVLSLGIIAYFIFSFGFFLWSTRSLGQSFLDSGFIVLISLAAMFGKDTR
jgi:hypothetical protein